VYATDQVFVLGYHCGEAHRELEARAEENCCQCTGAWLGIAAFAFQDGQRMDAKIY
jgi:hypothetical protein